MRDIIFKAKRVEYDEWVEGYYLLNETTKIVVPQTWDSWLTYEVIPETVGQYTGLKDESGKKIYEGDILQNYFIDDKQILECRYYDCGLVFEDKKDYSHRVLTNARIIGTIFDKDNVLKED